MDQHEITEKEVLSYPLYAIVKPLIEHNEYLKEALESLCTAKEVDISAIETLKDYRDNRLSTLTRKAFDALLRSTPKERDWRPTHLHCRR